MVEITKILAREVLDSRGNPTVEAELHSGSLTASAIVPSGASVGGSEALELRDGGKRFFGKGVRKAIDNVNKIIAPKIIGMDCSGQKEIDRLLIELDGTLDKSRLGANAALGVSMAAAKLAAAAGGRQLFEHLGYLYGSENIVLPCPQLNVINGGKHAGSGLAIQESMIVPCKARSFSEALMISAEVYHQLKSLLKGKFGSSATNVGDEGGFAPQMNNIEQSLEIILQAIEELGYQQYFGLALDCAASSFFANGEYLLEGKTFSAEQLLEFYSDLIKRFPIISIEDPFHEEDFDAFAELTKLHGNKVQIVGDDLLTTNVNRISHAIEKKSCNALLLKVNQIGTVSEAMDAARLAIRNNWKVVVSHRSGETEDTFIADLAVAISCGQIKTGAPVRGERTAKYNRLLHIEEMLGSGRYAKW